MITINEAIKTLTETGYITVDSELADFQKAIALGIEALKRCKEARCKAYFTTRTLLPSEKKE